MLTKGVKISPWEAIIRLATEIPLVEWKPKVRQ
jgi:hypothetical protein